MTEHHTWAMVKARKQESHDMSEPRDEASSHVYANVNLKLTTEEKWAFKEWCVHHRMTQVDAFRKAFKLLQAMHAEDNSASK